MGLGSGGSRPQSVSLHGITYCVCCFDISQIHWNSTRRTRRPSSPAPASKNTGHRPFESMTPSRVCSVWFACPGRCLLGSIVTDCTMVSHSPSDAAVTSEDGASFPDCSGALTPRAANRSTARSLALTLLRRASVNTPCLTAGSLVCLVLAPSGCPPLISSVTASGTLGAGLVPWTPVTEVMTGVPADGITAGTMGFAIITADVGPAGLAHGDPWGSG